MNSKVIVHNQVYTPKEAAELLNVTERTIRDYCRDGKINAGKIGDWRIYGAALANFLYGKPLFTDRRTKLIEALGKSVEQLNEIYKKKTGRSIAVALLQSVNMYADEGTLMRMTDDLNDLSAKEIAKTNE